MRNYISKNNELQWEAIELYNRAEVLIVPSAAMRQFLTDHGVRKDMKFVILEMWDCISHIQFFHTPEFRKEVHFIDGDRFEGINNWKVTLPLKLYASSSEHRKNAYYMGKLNLDEETIELSKGGFGLVWYRDKQEQQDMEYDVPFSLGIYLSAGIPVIVPSGISNKRLIEENHLGMIVHSIEEAAEIIEAMNESEYQKYLQCVESFAPAVRNGYYTKKCLIDAIQAFYRKDTGKILMPAKIYSLEEYVIDSVVLKKSYGGNLALSWCFSGQPDGFLIYGISGKLIYETDNVYQHYYLINNYDEEKGFIVKAYVETLKGKLIVAESLSVYPETRQYVNPKVSLIIPAYNAEDYIARSIDTALAQSFPDLEVIIVDDGSTDHTPDIVDWYAENYANVVVIHQENGGVPAARNTGIKHACGTYMGFMDNDDMLHPDMVARLYKSIEANSCDIAITSVYQITNSGYEIFIQYPMKENIAVSIEEFFHNYYIRECGFGVVVWNKLYRTSLVKEHLFPLLLHDDEAWTPYILSFADKVCYLNGFLYEYDRMIRDTTLVNKWLNRSKEEHFLIYKKTILFYLKNGNPKRRILLKELAEKRLHEKGIVYKYEKYEKFIEQIDKNFVELLKN